MFKLKSDTNIKGIRANVSYNDETFPLCTQTNYYKHFTDNTVSCHWHNDFEYGIVLSGAIALYINDTCIELKKDESYFINSNILHTSRQLGNQDAVVCTLTFSADLFTNKLIYQKYFEPLLNTRIEGFKISNGTPFAQDIIGLLIKIHGLEQSAYGYELKCQELLNKLWLMTLHYMEGNESCLLHSKNDNKHAERMKKMLSYIHNHYNEKITAADIAEHSGISRGECFRCFKHFMNKQLVSYINEYRLQRAIKLIRETEKSIIEISTECGFENTSYFGKIFKEAYQMTPYQYKKAYVWVSNTRRNINNYDYEYWKDSGNGTMVITSKADNGSFFCEWNNVNNIIFRSGRRFIDHNKTHTQIGNILLQYDAECNSTNNSYLCIYGWTVTPLIEWYILEQYTAYKHFSIRDEKCLGTFTSDDGTYELYCIKKTGKPSILGMKDFCQYWSIRISGRSCGNVNVSSHFTAWENIGLSLGNLTEVSLAVESVKSSGNALIRTNILTITESQK